MGTILERSDGRIVVQWVDAGGVKHQHTVQKRRADGAPLSATASRQEARRLLGELEDQVDRQRAGLAPRPLRNPRVTFGELHGHWDATRGASARSPGFVAWLRSHVEELFHVPAAEVTTSRVDRLLTALVARLSPKSVMHIRGHLHGVFEAARQQGGPWEGRENPVTAARRFKVPEKAIQLVTPAEWPRFAEEIPERWRTHVAVSFFTGLRRGDVFALPKAAVSLERGILTAAMSKTGKLRQLPIHSALRPYLEQALTTPGPALFAWPKGKRLPDLPKMLRRACGRAGLVTGYAWRCRRLARFGFTEEHATEAAQRALLQRSQEVGPPGIEPTQGAPAQGSVQRTGADTASFRGDAPGVPLHTDEPGAPETSLRAAPVLQDLLAAALAALDAGDVAGARALVGAAIRALARERR
jgi:integrase